MVFSTQCVQRGYATRTPAKLQLAESQAMKRKLGGWHGMDASPGVSQLKHRENCKRVCDENNKLVQLA
jgi:hypothetical protein